MNKNRLLYVHTNSPLKIYLNTPPLSRGDFFKKSMEIWYHTRFDNFSKVVKSYRNLPLNSHYQLELSNIFWIVGLFALTMQRHGSDCLIF